MRKSFYGIVYECVLINGRLAVAVEDIVRDFGACVPNVSKFVLRLNYQYRVMKPHGRGRSRWFVYEPGIYQLIFQLPVNDDTPRKYLDFRARVYESVLPQNRPEEMTQDIQDKA
jgi:prophage antirepressor-like protein